MLFRSAAAERELFEETKLEVQTLTLLSQKLIGEMMRCIYLGYLPDLQTAPIQLNHHETMEYKIITYAEWIEYLKTSRFDLDRAKAYSKELYDAIKEKTGKTTETYKPPAPKTYEKVENFGCRISSASHAEQAELYPDESDLLLMQESDCDNELFTIQDNEEWEGN